MIQTHNVCRRGLFNLVRRRAQEIRETKLSKINWSPLVSSSGESFIKNGIRNMPSNSHRKER